MLDKYGIELEFGAPIPDLTLSSILGIDLSVDSIYYTQHTVWSISEDLSASFAEYIGMEIRSPTWDIFPYDKVKGLCQQLSANGCRLTPTSGLHFHFSGPSYVKLDFLEEKTLQEISKRLFQIGKPRKERAKFCDPLGPKGTKRCALRQVADGHWECRVFNASFNIDEIKRDFDLMRKVLDEY